MLKSVGIFVQGLTSGFRSLGIADFVKLFAGNSLDRFSFSSLLTGKPPSTSESCLSTIQIKFATVSCLSAAISFSWRPPTFASALFPHTAWRPASCLEVRMSGMSRSCASTMASIAYGAMSPGSKELVPQRDLAQARSSRYPRLQISNSSVILLDWTRCFPIRL